MTALLMVLALVGAVVLFGVFALVVFAFAITVSPATWILAAFAAGLLSSTVTLAVGAM